MKEFLVWKDMACGYISAIGKTTSITLFGRLANLVSIVMLCIM
jgi:hypothetical protein